MSEIQVAGIPQIPIEMLDEYPDILICLEYLILKESESKLTMDQITEHLNMQYPTMPKTRQGLYLRIETWRRDGTLRQAETIFITPKIEEMRAAMQYVVTKTPLMLRALTDDVVEGKVRNMTKLEYTKFLYETVTKPILEKEQEPGSLEHEWLKKTKNFAPTDIEED